MLRLRWPPLLSGAACRWRRCARHSACRGQPSGAGSHRRRESFDRRGLVVIISDLFVPWHSQTGYLYTYALVMLLGLAAATTWAMAR